ncbi:MAG: hypothetical protein WD044_11555 [Dongiaceae bacterium]
MRPKRIILPLLMALIGIAWLPAPRAILADAYEESHDAWVREERALEGPVIEGLAGSLIRNDGTLSVVADNGVVATFADLHCYCSEEYHFYAMGFIEPISSFVILQAGSEWRSYHLVHKPTGQSVRIGAEPEIEPQSRQFVAINGGPSEEAVIEIGHESDTGIFLDARVNIAGYEFTEWVSSDRIALQYSTWMDFYLTKEEQEERGFADRETRQAELIRQDGVWHLVETISTPLANPDR